jgi:formamidopyrimidine-DNA glycosylase
MPELPEVETLARGLTPHLVGHTFKQVTVYRHALRWPIPATLANTLRGQTIRGLRRRAKYLLIDTDQGTLIVHLGMSGRLYLLSHPVKLGAHDHCEFVLDNGHILRFTDPRRFGALLWTNEDVNKHALLAHLGPEPLEKDFSADTLWQITRKRNVAIKLFIMTNQNVVGVGNIYATESLFVAGISPLTPAGQLTRIQCTHLVAAIRNVLRAAIRAGGTTLKDFVNSNGKPGYFSQALQAYGRAGQPCVRCHAPLKSIILGQRSTVYCTHCQR